MTTENTGEESSNERADQRNISIKGDADENTMVLGDHNTIHQGPIYYIIDVLGFLKAGQSPARLRHLREQLLQQMKTNVAKRLEDSLHNLTRVDLEAEEQRYQVGRRRKLPLVEVNPNSTQVSHRLVKRGLAVSKHSEKRESIPPAEQTYQIFHRSDIGERLLILGEPGSGKTTELLTVAQRLVDAAIEDDTQPIPLIFELSSWRLNIPIVRWLGQQLQRTYGVSKRLAVPLAKQWAKQSRILLLLDGLDELGQRYQIACVKELEDFLSQYPALPVVVCCRREEYEQGGERLKHLNGAIYLQSVELQKIQQYFKALRREQLWKSIQIQPELLKLAQLPLFLTMLVTAYHGQPIRDKSSLFSAYIQAQLYEPNHQGSYQLGKGKSPRQTLHYLGWLARQLERRNETEFLIENLQPDWMEPKQQRRTYNMFNGLLDGLKFGLFGGLFLGVVSGLSIGEFRSGLTSGLGLGLFGGLFFGLFFGLASGLSVVMLSDSRLSAIKPKEKMNWSFKRALIGGLCSGLLGLFFGPFGGLIGGLYGVLIGGLDNKDIEEKQVPNQGIQKSIRNGLFCGLILGLLGGLISGLLGGGLSERPLDGLYSGLLGGLSIGFLGGLVSGLEAAVQHFILRICLTKNGDTPWNYAQFLEHATRHRFIQRTGGRYRFVHDLLRQHFAQMTPKQQALLAQSTNSD